MNRILALVAMTLVVVALAWFSVRWFDRDADRFASDTAGAPGAETSAPVGGARRGDAETSPKDGPAPTVGEAADVVAPKSAVVSRPPAASFGLLGRAVDATGSPLAGVSVRVEELGVAPGRPGGAERRDVKGDAEGRFRIVGLRPRYPLRLRLRGVEHQDLVLTVSPGAAGETRDLGDLALDLGTVLRGRIVDEKGAAITGARIAAWRGDEARTGPALLRGMMNDVRAVRSDDAGGFALRGLGDGRWRLRVEATGRTPLLHGGVVIEGGRRPEELELVLERGRALVGLVVDTDGNPVAGARVRVAPAWVDPSSAAATTIEQNQVLSDAAGRFRVDGLATDAVNLQLRRAGFLGEDLIDHALGDDELRVTLRRSGIVWGRATSTIDGQPLRVEVERTGMTGRGRPLTLRRDGEAARVLGRDDADTRGLYVVEGLETARVTLVFRAEGHGALRHDHLAVTPGERLRLDVALVPEARITGRVLGANGEPRAGATVRVTRPPERPEDGAGFRVLGRQWLGETSTDAEGNYLVAGLPAGAARVVARGVGGERSEERSVALVAGETLSAGLELRAAGRVAGQVQDANGAPAPGEIVRLVAGGISDGSRIEILEGEGLDHVGLSDAEGRFVIEGLAPGDYRAHCGVDAASDAFPSGGMGGPARGVACEIREGETTELALTLPARGRVQGFVREAGRPVAGARVRLVESRVGAFGGRDVFTDAWGAFSFDDVRPGAWRLEARPPRGLVPVRHAFELTGGATERVELELPTGVISGRVTRDGEPLAGVQVVVRKWVDGAPEPESRGIMISVTADGDGENAETRSIGDTLNRVRTDARGRYRLRAIPEGDWQVGIEGQGVIHDRRAPIAVREGRETKGVDFAARVGASARIRLDDRPAERSFYLVALSPLEEGLTEARHRQGDGRAIDFEGLPPGEYRVKVQRISLSTGRLRDAGEETFTLEDGAAREIGVRIVEKED